MSDKEERKDCAHCGVPFDGQYHFYDSSLGPVGLPNECAPINLAKKQIDLLKEILSALKKMKGPAEHECETINEMRAENERLTEKCETLFIKGQEAYSENFELRTANAELVEALREFTILCENIKYHPNEYGRLELGEVYDKAKQALAKHGGKS